MDSDEERLKRFQNEFTLSSSESEEEAPISRAPRKSFAPKEEVDDELDAQLAKMSSILSRDLSDPENNLEESDNDEDWGNADLPEDGATHKVSLSELLEENS